MKIKKNLKSLMLTSLLLANLYIPSVHADATIGERNLIKINGQYVYKLYDNAATGTKNYRSESIAGKIPVTIDGENKIAFCVDYGISLEAGAAKNIGLKEHFAKGISEEKAEKLVNELTEYLKFGYGSEGKTSDKYYLATQKLIWEAISDSGFYTSDYFDEINGSNNKLKIENFRWTIDNYQTVIDLSTEINEIRNSINEYYQTPSFCSSQEKIEIEVGETAEYTDNFGVLSKFEVNCDAGIECLVEGNKLKVEAINEASSNNIYFTKSDNETTDNYLYKGDGQGVVVESGRLEPVSCQFGIDTFKNEKTADTKIIYVITIGLFGGIMAYIAYYTKKSLEGLQ